MIRLIVKLNPFRWLKRKAQPSCEPYVREVRRVRAGTCLTE